MLLACLINRTGKDGHLMSSRSAELHRFVRRCVFNRLCQPLNSL
jgi:hypothetical protein